MFVLNGSETQLISACGDTNNNVIMHPAVATGEDEGEVCIVTAIWDWSPLASWDSGKHWPSWQTADDGGSLGYIGEGGGCFGVGESKYVLCMHHHNVAFSSRCGKDFTRFVPSWSASVGPPEFTRRSGSRSQPSGMVYAAMTMPPPPWDAYPNKTLACDGAENVTDLGVHTNHSCLSHADIGTSTYPWYPGVNVAVWRGDGNRHCYLCTLSGNATSWAFADAKGATVFARKQGDEADQNGVERKAGGGDDDANDDDEDARDDDSDVGGDDGDDGDGGHEEGGGGGAKAMRRFYRHVAKVKQLERGEGELATPESGLSLEGGGPKWVLKSWNFGANWTYLLLPDFIQGANSFRADPTNDTTLYAVVGGCIARSYDQAETWEGCWQAGGLTGSFRDLVIKDSSTMLVMRNGDAPLRTRD